MKWFKFYLVSFVCVLGLSACAPAARVVTKSGSSIVSLNRYVTGVSVSGTCRAQIYDNAKRSRVVLSGMSVKAANRVRVSVGRDTVYIGGNEPKAGKIKVYVRHLRAVTANDRAQLTLHTRRSGHFDLTIRRSASVNVIGAPTVPSLVIEGDASFSHHGFYLRKFVHRGRGDVHITGVRGRAVDVAAYGPGSVNLEGAFTPINIVHRGSGNLTLTGIKGGNISMCSQSTGRLSLNGVRLKAVSMHLYGSGHYQLTGYMSKLTLYMHDSVVVSARGLKVYSAYLRTSGNAVLRIFTLRRIFARASDASRIEYYGHPTYKYIEALDRAAVLPMSKD